MLLPRILLLTIISTPVFSQKTNICKPKLSVYFPYNSSEIQSESIADLDKLVKRLGTQKEYIIQLISNTDSIGSVNYNHRLGKRRGSTVKKFFESSGIKTYSIDIINKGETAPKYDNSNDDNRQKNRRTDIVIFPVDRNSITLKGDRGTEVTISKDYFSPCSICEAQPQLQEILNGAQAAQAGIPLTTTDGMELITGGMAKLEHNCPKPLKDTCLPATIKFPIDTSVTADSTMGMWESVSTPQGMRWVRIPNGICTPSDEMLVTNVDCFNKYIRSIPKYNCDVPKCTSLILTPQLNRAEFLGLYDEKQQIESDSTPISTIGECPGDQFKIIDIGIKDGKIFTYIGPFTPYKTGDREFTIPLSAYSISYKSRIVLPNLFREKEHTPFIESERSLHQYSADELMNGINSSQVPTGMINDEGYDTNGIKYTIRRNLSLFEKPECPEPYTNCFLVPIGAYNKTLFCYDSLHIIKAPKKFVKNTQLLITPIDSSLATEAYKGKKNKYQFHLPKHPMEYLLTIKKPGYKESITITPDSKVIRKKYKKRKGYYKLKIRKGRLKKELRR